LSYRFALVSTQYVHTEQRNKHLSNVVNFSSRSVTINGNGMINSKTSKCKHWHKTSHNC